MDNLGIKGKVLIELFDEFGNLKQEHRGENLVVNTGENLIAQWLAGDAPTAPTHCAIGSSSTAAAAADTALGGELARVAFGSAADTDNAVEFVTTFNPGTGTGTVEEAGIFNAASSGTMLCRFLTTTFVKAAADPLKITWTLTIGT